ncbi:MAG: pyrophosphohydrolase domain-containing protein [Caulobacteraceae bacterium]
MKMPLSRPHADVLEFHRAFGHPAPDRPQIQPDELVQKRAGWIEEEVEELKSAETLHDQADAYIDILYFAHGGLVELGLDPSPLWAIVQAANMAKLGPDGTPLYHPDGKVRKPEGWIAPDAALEEEIKRQIDTSI